jgi:hypothetical protein
MKALASSSVARCDGRYWGQRRLPLRVLPGTRAHRGETAALPEARQIEMESRVGGFRGTCGS